jgi:hypothetical protein
MYIIRLNEEGKIAEHWGIGDMVGVMGQLGLLPAAGGPSLSGAK